MVLRTIIADDHPVVLMGTRAALEGTGDIDVVGEAANGDQLVDLLATHPCDVVVTDFSMPGGRHGDGLALIDLVRRRYPRLPIVVLTMVNNAAVLHTMRSRGALGLCDKRAPLKEVAVAVRQAAAGRAFLSDTIRRQFDAAGVHDTSEVARLSAREIEVVRLYVSGMSISQIAERLSRSVKTVSRQKRDAMRKLGIDHDSRLSEYARERGLAS
ncbi:MULTISPECIES: response regulator [unclassified Luteibacter]|uniref:response regulator n=1 Tax=unclassified Luteibacter TaxID=2620188 RepID=UPI0008D7638A|nr:MULTISPECIES: response regulator [unclassified Luteibacter]MDR6938048.1 two-component system capsular synthesis response regulator RcsB [Luteibacter sp. 3190]SEO99506.1 two-component system, NarL family, captular synthesis response regulator RcsB [Luteibacter sp. UNC138MFCol5.1]SEW20163.1 two component transcriptional regulator, LuxR family [Luteibacter sp. 329MFSha]